MVDAGIYARLSEVKSRDDLTADAFQRQQEACEALIRAHGWTVAEVYSDLESAYRPGAVRDDFDRMLEELADGRIKAVVSWSLDRISRNRRDFWRLLEIIEETGAPLLLVKDGLDSTSDTGRLVMGILIEVAQIESRNTGRRVSERRKQEATRGIPRRGGRRIFGWQDDKITKNPVEAGFIQEAAERRLLRESWNSITVDLTSKGLETVGGRKFRSGDFAKIVESPRMAGLRSYRREVIGKGKQEAILSRDTFEALRALAKRVQPRPRVNVLSGLVRCGRCGRVLRGHPKNDGTRRYECAKKPGFDGCGLTIVAEPLETLIRDATMRRLDSQEFQEALRHQDGEDADRAQAVEDLAKAEQALGELSVDYYQHRLLSRAEFLDNRRELEARIDRFRSRLTRASRVLDRLPAGGEALRVWWADATIQQRRAVLDEVVSEILVDPAPVRGAKFRPERVRVAWRV